jgi:hypothetical protein
MFDAEDGVVPSHLPPADTDPCAKTRPIEIRNKIGDSLSLSIRLLIVNIDPQPLADTEVR